MKPIALSSIVGQPATKALAAYVANPFPKCWLLHGPPGVGKSASGIALAAMLGCHDEYSGLHRICASELTIEAVRDLFERTFRMRPLFGGAWHVLLIEEFDGLTHQQVERYLKLELERARLPARLCVIATSNDISGLAESLLQRFDRQYYVNDQFFKGACLKELPKLWPAEVPMPLGWQRWGDTPDGFSMRIAVHKLEDALRGMEGMAA